MPKKKRTYRDAAARQRGMLIRRIISVSILCVIVITAAMLCFLFISPTFDIQNVICEGNVNTGAEAITNAAAVPVGRNIFLTGYSDAEKNVEKLDYIAKAKIERRLPDTVCIVVTEKQPSAYFSVGTQLALTGLDGTVIEVISDSADAEEIISAKITEDEPEPSGSPEPESTEAPDDNIWGYDDDGDPIYKVNGGHFEFDDDGNRFFVDDSAAEQPSASPQATAAAKRSSAGELNFDELPVTSGGSIIYDAPVVYGVNIISFKQGDKIKSDDSDKLETALGILRSLSDADLLQRATKIDIENTSDIKIYVEDRLEILFGTVDEFDYKVKFVSTVINDNLSAYEHAVLDFRGSKLYVRSDDSAPMRLMSSPSPSPDDEEKESEEDESDQETDEMTDEADEAEVNDQLDEETADEISA